MTTADYLVAEDPIAEAIAEYLAARDRGSAMSAADWLARHPNLSNELREFLDEKDGVATSLKSFRNGLREPNLQSEERFLGDYELLAKIGGNMGIVYRARQRSLPREVAVKVMLRSNPHDRTRFQTEAEAMARLHHANIARIIEVARGEGMPYFSMEWYSGGTLADRVAAMLRQPSKAAEVLEKVALAVHYAHLRGILHRDLKPANILMDEFGQPRVADFGLAVPMRELADIHGLRAGTPAYMAPEQLTGEVTVATDVYGLGAILYELLTGRAPSDAGSLAEVLERVRRAEPKPPLELNARVDADLNAICMKCLAREPADRYPSAAGVADDLKRYQQGQPTEARPLSGFGRVAHLIHQARTAGEFRELGPGILGQAAVVLATDVAVFALLQAGAAEIWVWLTLFVSYGPFFAIMARERWASDGRHNPVRLHLWSLWAGHAAACVAVFVALRIASGDDYVRGFDTGYVAGGALNALAFTVMGSVFAGRQYLLGFAWMVAVVVMGAMLSHAPLIHAVLMALCCLVTGLQLNTFQKSSASS